MSIVLHLRLYVHLGMRLGDSLTITQHRLYSILSGIYLMYKGDVVCVCVCVCVFAIHGYNDEPVETKLGMVI